MPITRYVAWISNFASKSSLQWDKFLYGGVFFSYYWYLVVSAIIVRKAIVGYKHASLLGLIELVTGCYQASLLYLPLARVVGVDVTIAIAVGSLPRLGGEAAGCTYVGQLDSAATLSRCNNRSQYMLH